MRSGVAGVSPAVLPLRVAGLLTRHHHYAWVCGPCAAGRETRRASDAGETPATLCRLGIAAALIVLLAVAAAPAWAQGNFGDIQVKQLPKPVNLYGQNTSHGYAEHRFLVTNRDVKSRTVSLALVGSGGRGDSLASLRNSISVGPGATAELRLYQPALPTNNNEVEVAVDGRRQDERLHLNATSHGSERGRSWSGSSSRVSILVSRGVSAELPGRLNASWGGGAGAAGIFRSDMGMESWSDNWLGYTAFDAIFITTGEVEQMPAAARAAVMNWTEAGGVLVVLGDWQPPAHWITLQQPAASATAVSPAPEVSPRPGRPVRPRATSQDNGRKYFAGFGECLVVAAAHDHWSQPLWDRLRDEIKAGANIWAETHTVENANNSFPVVDKLEVPVRGMFIIMLLFALVVGPVNLIVLARKRRRIWLLWTVPIISLVACGLVFGHAVLAEGFSGRSRTSALTILNEQTSTATSIGWTAFYSPLTPGGGLHYGYETEISPHGLAEYYSEAGRPRSLDWSRDQHLASGWVAARVPAHFQVRKVQARRERLAIHVKNGQVSATNGLGAPIEALSVAGPDGRVYEGQNIAAGQEIALQALPQSENVGKVPPEQMPSSPGLVAAENWRRAFLTGWIPGMVNIEQSSRAYLRPGTYVAKLVGSPFVENGLAGSEPRPSGSCVLGILGGWGE